MKQNLRILILVGVALLVMLAMFCVGHLSRIHSRLKTYKTELRARGEKLTFQELGSGYSSNAESSEFLKTFTNAVAGIVSFPLHPSTLEIRKYVGPGRARSVWMVDRPWGIHDGHDTWEDFGTEVDELESTLAAIRASLRDPPPTESSPPRAYWGGRPIGDFVAMRNAAQWLAGATLYELRRKRLEEALNNLEALAAIGRLNRNDSRLVTQMIRVAVTSLGLAVTWEFLQADGCSEPQLEQVQKTWERVELIDGLETSFLAERALGMQLWSDLRSPGGSRRLKSLFSGPNAAGSPQDAFEQFTSVHLWLPAYKLTSIDDDELFYLQGMQEGIDALRLLKAGRPWRQARQGVDQSLNRMNQTAKSWQRFRYLLSMISTPNLSRAADIAIRDETERNLTITAIALKRFQLQHGALPDSLEALVPKFLTKVPQDPMAGGPLHYQLRQKGAFCLYSVGEDGRDDGGDPIPLAGKFGLWEGRDAVWPVAVKPDERLEPH